MHERAETVVDKDLEEDASTRDIFYYPVSCNDGHVHEASSVLQYLKSYDAKSPWTREEITSANPILPLRTTLAKKYKESNARHAPYDVDSAMNEIQQILQSRAEEKARGYSDTYIKYCFSEENERSNNVCCLPPVSFWSKRFNHPAINAAVNTFASFEVLFFLLALDAVQENATCSGILDVGIALFNSVKWSACAAAGVGVITAAVNCFVEIPTTLRR